MSFSITLRRSRFQYCFWLSLHLGVLLFIVLARLPPELFWGLTLSVVVLAFYTCWQYRHQRGVFASVGIACDSDHQWYLQIGSQHPVSVNLWAYQFTPWGLAACWVAREAGGWRHKRYHLLVTRDQLPEGEYRWLKVLLRHANPPSR